MKAIFAALAVVLFGLNTVIATEAKPGEESKKTVATGEEVTQNAEEQNQAPKAEEPTK